MSSGKKRILNLYAGIGGNRKLWQNCEVTAVELDPKIAAVYALLYPDDTLIIGDAHKYLLDHYSEFDVIWSSPPCQKNSRMVKFTRHKLAGYPDLRLYEEIIFLGNFFKGYFIVENVVPYYKPLIDPGAKIGRHLFWSNFDIPSFDYGNTENFINTSTINGADKLKDWLGIHYPGNLYYDGNHDACQVLRNCVHPSLGCRLLSFLPSI
jgi:DNA (cytosine-5)-methyltransferase 1